MATLCRQLSTPVALALLTVGEAQSWGLRLLEKPPEVSGLTPHFSRNEKMILSLRKSQGQD